MSLAPHSPAVLVCGGGIVGAATASAIQHLNRNYLTQNPIPTLMVDRAPTPSFDNSAIKGKIRTVALSRTSGEILNVLGVWNGVENKHAYYRMAIRHEASNSPSRSNSFFLSSLLGAPSTAPTLDFSDLSKPMGFIAYNDELHAALHHSIADDANVSTISNASVAQIVLPSPRDDAGNLVSYDVVAGGGGSSSKTPTTTATDTTATTKGLADLIVGCEGRDSQLRSLIGSQTIERNYEQHGFVVSVELEAMDDGNVCCFQNFFLDGSIVGFLPTGPTTANIVYSQPTRSIKQLLGASAPDIIKVLNSKLNRLAPNDIPLITGIVGDGSQRAMGAFPLRLSVATTPYAPRALLIGDAAHAVHPMAGQGLNMGLYDVAALTDTLLQARHRGVDLGSATAVGVPVATAMLQHTAPMIAAMEFIKGANVGLPVVSILGMKTLDALSPVKSVMMSVASGDHLRSLRGENSVLLKK